MHPLDAPPPGATCLDQMLEDMLRRRYLVVDGQGRISRWSSGAEQLLGWQEQEVVGRSAFGQPLAWAGEGLALWQTYFDAAQGARPPEQANLVMLCRGGWGLSVEMTAVPVPLVLGYEFTMLVADLSVGGSGLETADQLAQLHPLASDAIASALDVESPPVDAVAGLLVTLRPVSEAAVIEDTDAQHAARALAMECDEPPATAPTVEVVPEADPEPVPEPAAQAQPDPQLASLRAQLEQVESERDSLRAELSALPDKAAFEAARRDRDEARSDLAAALTERDRASEALADATQQRDDTAAALRQAEAERKQDLEELRWRLEDAERTAAERAAEVEAATREAAEQRERVAAGHLATEALARERARVSELESQIAMLSGRLDRAGSGEAIPRKRRDYDPDLDGVESPRAYIGLDGRFTALNDGFCKLVGYSEAEFSTAHWPPVIDAEHRSALRRTMARLVAGKLSSSDVDTFYMSGNGDLVRVLGTLTVDRDEAGAPRRLVLDAQPLSAVTA